LGERPPPVGAAVSRAPLGVSVTTVKILVSPETSAPAEVLVLRDTTERLLHHGPHAIAAELGSHCGGAVIVKPIGALPFVHELLDETMRSLPEQSDVRIIELHDALRAAAPHADAVIELGLDEIISVAGDVRGAHAGGVRAIDLAIAQRLDVAAGGGFGRSVATDHTAAAEAVSSVRSARAARDDGNPVPLVLAGQAVMLTDEIVWSTAAAFVDEAIDALPVELVARPSALLVVCGEGTLDERLVDVVRQRWCGKVVVHEDTDRAVDAGARRLLGREAPSPARPTARTRTVNPRMAAVAATVLAGALAGTFIDWAWAAVDSRTDDPAPATVTTGTDSTVAPEAPVIVAPSASDPAAAPVPPAGSETAPAPAPTRPQGERSRSTTSDAPRRSQPSTGEPADATDGARDGTGEEGGTTTEQGGDDGSTVTTTTATTLPTVTSTSTTAPVTSPASDGPAAPSTPSAPSNPSTPSTAAPDPPDPPDPPDNDGDGPSSTPSSDDSGATSAPSRVDSTPPSSDTPVDSAPSTPVPAPSAPNGMRSSEGGGS
jgi:hypothetical protein